MKRIMYLGGLLLFAGLVFSGQLMASDHLSFDYDTRQFRADFSQRNAAQLALQQKKYVQAMILFKQSFQAVPSQKALHYFCFAFHRSKRIAPTFSIIASKDIQIHSPLPLHKVIADQYHLPQFLFTQWWSHGVVITIPPFLHPYVATSSHQLILESLSGKQTTVKLDPLATRHRKRIMSTDSATKSQLGISGGIDLDVETLLASYVTVLSVRAQREAIKNEQLRLSRVSEQVSVPPWAHREVLLPSMRLSVYIESANTTVLYNQFEGEVYVAILDIIANKTLAVKAFFNQADSEKRLQHNLARDIALFAATF